MLLGAAAGREMWGRGLVKEKAWKKSLLGRLEAELLRRLGPLLRKWWAIGRPGAETCLGDGCKKLLFRGQRDGSAGEGVWHANLAM